MFPKIQKKLQKRFDELNKSTLFTVTVDRDKIWEIYLNAFAEEFKQSNNCNCCKSYLRQYGGIVGIDKDNKMISLWDFEAEDDEYNEPIKALREYIHSLPITGIFLNPFPKCGTEKNLDKERNVVWNHFYIELPSKFVKTDIGPVVGTALDNKNVLKRSLDEITDDAIDTTLELIGQNSLYRGQEFKGMVTELKKTKDDYKKVKKNLRDNYCWKKSNEISQAVCRINNSSIGTLLKELSEGKELDKAVLSFERVVAPANYKRPTALVTPRMIEEAKKRLEEMGLVDSLNRRILSDKDLTVDNTLFVNRAKNTATLDIFDDLKKDVTVNPKTLTKVEEVSINDFITKILPTAKSIKLLVENSHFSNFVTLVGAQDKENKSLFKWGNDFSWSYTGGVADSIIKERVKNAGGNVEGILRISLSWHNYDDLDLHLHEPNGKYVVYYGNKRMLSPSGAMLDVDMNAGGGISREPVENIFWTNEPKIEGDYKVIVNNFSLREKADTGFSVEVEYNGEVNTWDFPRNGGSRDNFTAVDFNYSKKNGITFLNGKGTSGSAKYNSKEKWGIKSGQFHRVKSITLSPNYWTEKGSGNKHFMFFLDNCKSDENTRPFYNEFLSETLSKDRKVFELLGSKVMVEGAEQELSGLGFSETVKTEFFCEVEGAFKRIVKVKI